jgi:hypothetical protein
LGSKQYRANLRRGGKQPVHQKGERFVVTVFGSPKSLSAFSA